MWWLKALKKDEIDQIRDAAVRQAVEDCEQDRGYLRGIVEGYIESLDICDQLNAISEDNELLVEALGFNPYEEAE